MYTRRGSGQTGGRETKQPCSALVPAQLQPCEPWGARPGQQAPPSTVPERVLPGHSLRMWRQLRYPEALQPTASLRHSQASSKDTGQLYAALHHRILALRSRMEQEQEAKLPAPEPGAAPSNEDDSDEDVLAPSGATGGGELGVPALVGVGTLTEGAPSRVGA